MERRSWWTRGEVLAAGLFLAAALAWWQADRLSEGAGSHREASRREATIRHARGVKDRLAGEAAARHRDDPAGPTPAAWDGRPGGAWSAARTSPHGVRPEGSASGLLDRSTAIATGLAPPESEEERAARLAAELAKLARDLEFTAGLREPPQQRAAAAPEPWRPDPEAEGRPAPVVEDVSPRRALSEGGEEVVIHGRNLRVAQVMFGITSARIVEAGPTRVTVVAPRASPGEVRIAVTNDDGHGALAEQSFSYER